MFDALVLQWRVSIDYTEVHILPHRQSFFRSSILQDPNKMSTLQVSTKLCFIKDEAMVTDAQGRYTDFCECIWVVYIYIWSISRADVGVILVGDSISWVRPSSVIVESQEEWLQHILKSPNKRMSA